MPQSRWRPILGLAVVFVSVALAGPALFYGIGYLYDLSGGNSLIVTIAIGSSIALWFFGVLWAFSKLNGATGANDETHLNGEARHGR